MEVPFVKGMVELHVGSVSIHSECLDHEVAAVLVGQEGITKAKEFHPEVVSCNIGVRTKGQ